MTGGDSMTASAVLIARARRAALAQLSSRVTVRRGSGTQKVNGIEVSGWADVHVDLPFRLVGGRSHTVTVGGVQFEEATALGDMPADTTDLADDDLIDITAGEWAGSVFRVVEAVKGDQSTVRRVPIVETQRPKEWQ